MTETQQFLFNEVRKDHDYIVNLRRWFHQHPELGKEEFKTQAAIERELDKLGIVHRRIAGTGVYGAAGGYRRSAHHAGKRAGIQESQRGQDARLRT